MKILVVSILILGSMKAQAGMKILAPSTDIIVQAMDRPSCEMLAWRWVKTLSRLQEKDLVLKNIEETGDYDSLGVLASRVPEEAPEGLSPQVQRRMTFKIAEARIENVKILEIDTPSVLWKNVTENTTDLITISVQTGKILVEAPTVYADYCFSQRPSEILIELAGKRMKLAWKTRQLSFQKYMNVMNRQSL